MLISGGQALGQGFPNVPQTPGTLLAGPLAPEQGRTAVITIQGGWVFSFPEIPSSGPVLFNGSLLENDYQMRQWDISNLSNVREVARLGVTTQGFDAHGVVHSGNWTIFGTFQFHVDQFGGPRIEEPFTEDHVVPFSRGGLFPPYSITNYWSYNDTNIPLELTFQGDHVAQWDHIAATGIIGHPVLMGNLLFMLSEQTNGGIAIYDMSLFMDGNPSNDPAQPPLITLHTIGGFGGYWSELYGLDGRLYAVTSYRIGGQGLKVIDVTDPTTPGNMIDIGFSADVMSMYPHFQDQYIFSGSSKVDMRAQQVVLTLPTQTAHTIPGYDDGDGIDTSQWALPVGNLLITGGLTDGDRSQGMAIWAHQAEPDTRGPMVGYHIPRAGQTNYPVAAPISMIIPETLDTATLIGGQTFIVRPLGGNPISGSLFYAMNDMITFQPDDVLMDNTTYEVFLPQGGIEDAVGNGLEQDYSFTFSTGSSIGGNVPPEIQSFTVSDGSVAPGTPIQFSVSATDSDQDTLEYRFIFGDDSPPTAWSGATTANKTYGAEDHYSAMVQVRDPSGVTVSDNLTVTVKAPLTGPRPTQSSQIVIDEAARRVYAVNPDNNTVAVIHADTHARLSEYPVSADPRSVALDGSGRLWVTAHDADCIDVLNAATGALVDSIKLDYGDAPFGVVMSPDRSTAYVSLTGSGELLRFDAATMAQTGSLALGPTPRALAVDGNHGRILVTRFISASFHGQVWDVSATTFTLTRTFVLSQKIAADNSSDGAGIPNYLASVTITPDNRLAWITAVKTNTNKGVHFGDGSLNDPDNTVRTELISIDLTTNTVRDDNASRIDLDNSDSAAAIAFSPLGDYMLVVNQGTKDLLILDTFRFASAQGLGSMVARVELGLSPQGIAVDTITETAFVKNFMGRSVSMLSIASLLATGDSSFQVSEVSTVQNELLSPQVLEGKQVFYNADDPRMSSEGYISCATCHVDGGHDGRTWDFTQRGEGFRNTIPLWGRAGTGHGRVHWTANFDEIQDFENDIRGHFGGTGFLTSEDFAVAGDPLGPTKAGRSQLLDAMAAYLASLDGTTLPRSPFRAANGDMTADAMAGRDIFIEQGCATCHNPAQQYTDRQLRDTGTIRQGTSGQRINSTLVGLETPTLLSLWESAPYLHDGSAPTLESVFRQASGRWYDNEDGTNSGSFPSSQFPTQTWLYGSVSPLERSLDRSVTWTDVDGGSGGMGQIMFRFATDFNAGDLTCILTVNGVSTNVVFPPTDPDSGDRPMVLVENVNFQPGETNTVILRNPGSFEKVDLDAMFVSHADDLAKAEPHRRALNLGALQFEQLMAYLRQLDSANIIASGSVERRFWQSVAGGVIADLEADPRYPDQPEGADILTRLEAVGWAGSGSPGASQSWADSYGQQVRGYLRPAETGNYVFFLSGDDSATFSLSPDEDPANAIEVASLTSASAFRTWDTFTSQASRNNGFSFGGGAPGVITLQAGQRYFFEIVHKESGGTDHVSLAWRTPSGGSDPTNGSDAAVVPGTVLEPFADTFREKIPASPSDLFATAYSISEIHVAFIDHAINELGYELEYRFVGGDWQTTDLEAVGGIGTKHQVAIRHLVPGSDYEIRLRAFNAVGPTEWLTPVAATTLPAATERLFTFDGARPFYIDLGLNLLQQAKVVDDNLVLWQEGGGGGQRSAVWSTKTVPTAGFVTEFTFGGQNVTLARKSDLVFVLQAASPEELALGNDGGYEGVSGPKFGLVFSLTIPDANVRGLIGDAEIRNYFNTNDQGFEFAAGQTYTIRVIYDARQKEVTLEWRRHDNGQMFQGSFPIDLEEELGAFAYPGLLTNNNFADLDMVLSRWIFDARTENFSTQAPFGGTARAIPSRIQSEDYDLGGVDIAFHDNDDIQSGIDLRGDPVDIATGAGVDGHYVGFIASGEWLKYTVEVMPGRYDVRARISGGDSPSTQDIAVSLDGLPITVFDRPNTNFQFQTIQNENVDIPFAGQQVLRIDYQDSTFNMDWIEFTRIGDLAESPATPTGLSANAVNSGRVDVTFTDQATNEASFSVEYRVAGTVPWQSMSVPAAAGTGTSVTVQVAGLSGNTTYEFRAKARRAQADSPWTSVDSATTSVAAGDCAVPVTLAVDLQDLEICNGDDVTLLALASGESDPAPSYQWFLDQNPIGGAVSPELLIESFDGGDAGNYHCEITNSCGTTLSATATLSLTGSLNLTTQPANQTVCENGPALLSVVASGGGSLEYQWHLNGSPIAGATLPTFAIDAAQTTDAGNYHCEVTGGCGTVDSSTAVLTVMTEPIITAQPEPTQVCAGNALNLSVTASGGGIAYQWFKDENALAGATQATLSIGATSANDAGSYQCRLINGCGNAIWSNSVDVVIGDNWTFISHPQTASTCEGQSATFEVSIAGNITGYQWLRNGVPIAGATQRTYTIQNVDAGDVAQYRCRIIGLCSQVDSQAASLTLEGGPSVTTNPVSQSLCLGETLTLTVAGVSSSGGLGYQWFWNNQEIVGFTSPTFQLVPALNQAGQYRCRLTDNCGETFSEVAVVEVVQLDVSVDEDDGVVGVDPPELFAEVACADLAELEWFNLTTQAGFGLGVNPIVLDPLPIETTTYRVIVTSDDLGQEVSGDVTVLIPDDATFFDFNGDGCNDVGDLYEALTLWQLTDPIFDANDDDLFNILDLMFIKITGDNCPGSR
ncbi:immunoglobulin domain-containing protein [Sulfidibacter corallicola]|uniref:Immunoglobulin domain-containing protein n=1 Tax=Sulfidibacter corallicola TaxID=2818388 RepID=A0A8A4TTK4_SULCO|nr:immunoglobulin domain-containing protein [Sulfidibacter corallicola]QTD52707.1 immunoglobulin domain-containing protein [Sulfidibacter corallicola]